MYGPENTLTAFDCTLKNPAVSRLEPDTGVTEDGLLVVAHDRAVNGRVCKDTSPVKLNGSEYPSSLASVCGVGGLDLRLARSTVVTDRQALLSDPTSLEDRGHFHG